MSASPAAVYSVIGLLFGLALVGAAAGIWTGEQPGFSRKILPFSGGLLSGVAFFWLLPEIAKESGWLYGFAGMAAACALLWLINRFLYPICPACSDTHDHGGCPRQLHGFTAPLLTAAAIHSLLDGWSVGLTQQPALGAIRFAFLAGIGAHKIPEGLALGAMLLAATGSVWKAGLFSALAQSAMFLGAWIAIALTVQVLPQTAGLLLAGAAGVFVFLGFHAIEGQWHRGAGRAVVPALTGAVGAAVLRLVPGW